MKRIPDRLRLLLALLVMTAFAATGACEMLDLSTLGDIEEAQMIEEERVWTYPIPYELLMNSDYLLLVNRDNLLDKFLSLCLTRIEILHQLGINLRLGIF